MIIDQKGEVNMGKQQPFDDNNFIPIDYTDVIRATYAEQNNLQLPKIDQQRLLKNRMVAEIISDELVKEYQNNQYIENDFVSIFTRQVLDFAYIISDESPAKWTDDTLIQAMGLTLGSLVIDVGHAELVVSLLESIMAKLIIHELNSNVMSSTETHQMLEDIVPKYLQEAADIYNVNDIEEDDEAFDGEDDNQETSLVDLKTKYFFEVLNASGVLDLYEHHHSIRPVIKKHISFLGDHPELLVLTILYAPSMREWLEMQLEMGDWSEMNYTISDFFVGVNSMFLQDVITTNKESEMIHYTEELKALINGMLVTTPPALMVQSFGLLVTGDEMRETINQFITNLVSLDQLTDDGLNLAQDIIYNLVQEIYNQTFATFNKWTMPMISTVLVHQFQTFDVVGVDGFEFVDDIVLEFARWLGEQKLISASQVKIWEEAVERAQLPRYQYALLADIQDYLSPYRTGNTVMPIY